MKILKIVFFILIGGAAWAQDSCCQPIEFTLAEKVQKQLLDESDVSASVAQLALVDKIVGITESIIWKDLVGPFLSDLLNPDAKKLKEQNEKLGAFIRQKFTREGAKVMLGLTDTELDEYFSN